MISGLPFVHFFDRFETDYFWPYGSISFTVLRLNARGLLVPEPTVNGLSPTARRKVYLAPSQK
jgi:hypothetical protein